MLNRVEQYMPAEWERHERTLMEWPVKSSMIWPENYEKICAAYAEVAGAISEFEPVTMIVNNDTAEEAKALCGKAVECRIISHNDAWCRDNGPTFLKNKDGQISAVNWQFNAWGEKYKPYDLDNQVAPRILQLLRIPYRDAPMVMEGGSFHTDGEGTLMTTRECLLNKKRNPDLNREQIEEALKGYLGVSKILWLSRGLFGDETDGHVDNVACFVRPGVIVMQTCRNPEDPNYEITEENTEILRNSTDAAGRKLKIVELPQPPARFYRGERLTLSYLNFYLVNGGLILPVFGGDAEKADHDAVNILRETFPDRRIVTVDGGTLITEGGNVHCITQQMPEGVKTRQ